MEYLELKTGYRTALLDGTLVPDSPKHMATECFCHAVRGSRLHLQEGEYLFAVAVFSMERNQEYINTYCYAKEENWSTYTQNLTPETYQEGDYIFEEECYFRVCIRRKDNSNLGPEDAARASVLVEFYHEEPEYEEKPYFKEEIAKTAASVCSAASSASLKLCLLADTHYTVNGTWEDTASNIQKVAALAGYHGIIHLGDLTDGMVSKEMTRKYVRKIMGDLERCKIPLYITLGNHDSNYFRNRGEFSKEEMKTLYKIPGEGMDYYVDMEEYSVRMIFLSSFEDKAPVRYGYTKGQLIWLKETLYNAPAGTGFLIFSHDAPLAKLDYWSFLVRNGEELLDILEECNALGEYRIISFFYGHTHGDYVFEECSFPVISVGCAKLEYFLDKKPEGAIVYEREAGTVTQDLWDSLVVDLERQKLKLIRFGAGEDREVSFARNGERMGLYKKIAGQKRKERPVKIWAHRGASSHAPENTMPAFELAYRLGADGIELDVQLTRDGIPVVIHDETVDRVSDGTGWVKDYTLDEIRKLNVNKEFPAYGRATVPTLEEVYDFIRDTDMTVNLELKNGAVFYEGLEEKVLTLAEKKGIADRVIYSSFNHYSMRKIKELVPEAKIAFLYSNGILDMPEYARKHGAYALHPSMKNIEYPDMLKECREKGIRVHVWTVNRQEDMERMRKLGVDAVITNYVERG